MNKYRTRTLGGTLLVIKGKGMNDCATIERDKSNQPKVVHFTGSWTLNELQEALALYNRSEAAKR